MTSLPIDTLRDMLPNQLDIQYIQHTRLHDANFNHVICCEIQSLFIYYFVYIIIITHSHMFSCKVYSYAMLCYANIMWVGFELMLYVLNEHIT